MIFSKTYKFRTELSSEEIKSRLMEEHIKVKDMDFEVYDKENQIKVIPHAENTRRPGTLPITHIKIHEMGDGSRKVKVYCKMRRIDAGIPYLVVIFCTFCLAGAILLYALNQGGSLMPSLVLIGVAIVIYILLWVRMESGYYQYIHKINHSIKGRLSVTR